MSCGQCGFPHPDDLPGDVPTTGNYNIARESDVGLDVDCNLNWKARVPQSVPVNSARLISSEGYNVLCLIRLALRYASRYPVVNLQTLMTVYYEYFFYEIPNFIYVFPV